MAIVTAASIFLAVWGGVLLDEKKVQHGWQTTVHAEPSQPIPGRFQFIVD